ncbi:DUF1330 domain-containing protein [Aquamicrobium terrae]
MLEGADDGVRNVIVEFPDIETARRWYDLGAIHRSTGLSGSTGCGCDLPVVRNRRKPRECLSPVCFLKRSATVRYSS